MVPGGAATALDDVRKALDKAWGHVGQANGTEITTIQYAALAGLLSGAYDYASELMMTITEKEQASE